jgi:hypothetical protein
MSFRERVHVSLDPKRTAVKSPKRSTNISECHVNRDEWGTGKFKFVFNETKRAVVSL